jgi:prepilin-type N-terminal cleavage/methylation domain-containing protein
MADVVSKYRKDLGLAPLEITESSFSKTKRNHPLSLTGFTLVEIMVVVSILALLAAVSIPMMLRNQINANETAAIASCRTIVSSCQSFYSYSMPRTYPPDLVTLGTAGPSGPAYLDNVLASGAKSGYNFTYSRTSQVTFTVNADPQVPGRTGVRYFYSDETGRITAREGGQAGPGDPAIN